MVDEEDRKDAKFDFDAAGEEMGYIRHRQAESLWIGPDQP
jgi:hypothetical protein